MTFNGTPPCANQLAQVCRRSCQQKSSNTEQQHPTAAHIYVLYGKYYETFALFKQACDTFSDASERYKKALRSLLTDNFQIIDSDQVPKFEVW